MSAGWSATPEDGALVFVTADSRELPEGCPTAFLDRDGTLNETVADPESGLPESPLRPEEVQLLPGVVDALHRLSGCGYALVCVSNQPAAAKGKVSVEELQSIHERLVGLLADAGVRLDASLLCPHHPDGQAGPLRRACSCRKPAPGMLLNAAAAWSLELASSWMIGDTDADVAAGSAAGCRTALIEYPRSAHKRLGAASPDVLRADLAGAVAYVVDRNTA